ncbi:hypothetical protein DAEQUDRAFT_711029 [Daedalea quercina L-15889]|uniref:non-specific serine/threonine protein kinase n=1 Tax=Daedalea quercina L-15889 TaxID=1314783 RepID=A0A165Q6E1_9APHY|nr:hypothetical protein DAEQUDRAFT_711029 [Daedalea quercina L-15889]
MESPTSRLLESATPISQGAEAKVFRAYLHPSLQRSSSELQSNASDIREPILLKYRFHKQYRHPTLDTTLTKARVAGEARAIIKCLRHGVNVPGIRMVDATEGVLGLEWIDGKTVRFLLGGGAEDEDEDETLEEGDEGQVVKEDPLKEYGVSQDDIMGMIGSEIAKMHSADIIHGDLTTSNMIVRHPTPPKGVQLVLIDFGLAYTSTLAEDKAVDLYVLERAFSSTHPASEPLFASVLSAYKEKMGKDWLSISKRLDDVRLRGRKRSMVG